MAFQTIDDDFGKFGKILSKELAAAIKTATDMIDLMVPAGEIVPIMTNIAGVPAPDPNIWQECDGSEITNQSSPLRSQPSLPRYTPDMTDRYLRISANLGLAGSSGGVNQFAGFGHSHTIEPVDADEGAESAKGGVFDTASSHDHGTSTELANVFQLEPVFYVVKFFMRIQ